MHWLWSLHEKGTGGILADDMGLGKVCTVACNVTTSNLFCSPFIFAVRNLLDCRLLKAGVGRQQ